MTQKIYQFDDFLFDTSTRTLMRDAESIPLENKVASTLQCLIENHGQTVSKRQLIDTVWQTSIVEDSGLRRNISVLRSTLDKTQPNRYIETVPGSGYRFCGTAVLKDQFTMLDAPRSGSIVLPSNSKPDAEQLLATPASTNNGRSKQRLRNIRWSWPVIGAIVLGITSIALFEHIRNANKIFVTQVTTNSVELPVITTAISADGTLLAYADAGGLHIRPIHSIESKSWQTPHATLPSVIQWFPDGKRILLTSFDTHSNLLNAWIVTSQQAPQLVVSDIQGAGLSPDGTQLAFFRGENKLFVADINGNDQSLLLDLKEDSLFKTIPHFSSDGKSILFIDIATIKYAATHPTESISRIRSLDLETKAVTTVYTAEPEYILDFATNFRSLLVSQRPNDNGNGSELIKVNFSASSGEHFRIEKILDWPDRYIDSLSTSLNGDKVAVIGNQRQSDIYIADLDDQQQLSNTRLLTFDTAHDRPFSWLPDSRTLLFYSDRNGSFNLYQQNIEAPNATLLVHDKQDLTWPVISPNQKWLYYFSSDPENYSWNASSVLMRKSITSPAPPESLGTSPDLDRTLRCSSTGAICIIAEQTLQQRSFYEFDETSGRGKLISSYKWLRHTNRDWSLSPNGTRIAYLDDSKNLNQISIIDSRTGAHLDTVSVVDKGKLTSLAWDAKGSGFFVTTQDHSYNVLRLLYVSNSGDTKQLTIEVNNRGGWALPSPDGKHLAIHSFTQHANVWMLETSQ